MSVSEPYFCIRIVDGRHVAGYTTDGRDWYPIPKAAFGSPRDAVRYCEMRQAKVSPLRSRQEEAVARAVSPVPPGVSPAVTLESGLRGTRQHPSSLQGAVKDK